MTIPTFGIGSAINVPVLLESRLLVQANSGGGKSWALRRLLEQTAPMVQQLIIDPEGEFATLREKFDYVIAAPRGADAIASPQTAALLARRLLESGVSAVLDIYDLRAHERQQFVKRFIDALVNAPRALWHPVMLVIDEAHVFCPQNGSAEAAQAVIDVCTRGRKRGLCPVLATQRLSKLHKDAAAEMLNKLVGRTGLDVDVKRAADELGMTARDATEQLRTLPPGTFFAFGPALSPAPVRTVIGTVQTTHPKAGQRLMQAPPTASKRVLDQLAKLADLQRDAEQEAKTIEELRGQVTDLQRRTAAAEKRAIAGGVPEAEVLARIRAAVTSARAEAPRVSVDDGARKALSKIAQLAAAVLGAGEATASGDPIRMPAVARIERSTAPARGTAPKASVSGLRSGAVKILQELAARAPAGYSKPQVGALTKFSHKGGTFNTYLSDLRRGGLIEERNGLLFASGDGVRSLGDQVLAKPTSHEEVMAQWRTAMRSGAFAMLECIVQSGRTGIDRRGIAEQVGMVASGGTFNTYLSVLRRNGLITDDRGQCRANDILFPEQS